MSGQNPPLWEITRKIINAIKKIVKIMQLKEVKL